MQGKVHNIISWFLNRNSTSQKEVTWNIPGDEREEPTNKNTLPSATVIQIWWRNQKLYRQEKILRKFSTTKENLETNAKGKDPDAGKDLKQEEKGRQRMRRLDDISNSMDMSLNKRQWWIGKLAGCSPWGHKELDTTEWLIWTERSLSSQETKEKEKTCKIKPKQLRKW